MCGPLSSQQNRSPGSPAAPGDDEWEGQIFKSNRPRCSASAMSCSDCASNCPANRTAQTQTEAPRDGLRPRSAHWFPVRVLRCAASAAFSFPWHRFDASCPSFVGPSPSRSRGHEPPLAPSSNGFPAVPWILGPPSRSRTLPAALAALRFASGFRPHRPGARCASITFAGVLGVSCVRRCPRREWSLRDVLHGVERRESLVHKIESPAEILLRSRNTSAIG